MHKKQVHPDPATEYMRILRNLIRLTVDWTNTAAEALGVHPTELMAGSHLLDAGEMTAGELAEATGLTTGAMTAAIDRLEHAGLAKREADPHDRRKVIVKPTRLTARLLAMRVEAIKKFRPVFSRYSVAELARMTEATSDIIAIFEEGISGFKRSIMKPDHRREVRKR